MKKEFCCQHMKKNIEHECTQHNNVFECPDHVMYYGEVFDEYGIIIHDGTNSYIGIDYCPWCGKKLPDSCRDKWFEELEKLGYDSPCEQEIPETYKSYSWRMKD